VIALVGIGSNIEPERHLKLAARLLRARFPGVRFSAVYRSAPVGMTGDDFLNACCLLDTGLSRTELKDALRSIEEAAGRDRSEGSWRPRTLDLDLLMVDGRVVDDDLFAHAHAYVPASELVPLSFPRPRGTLERVGLRL